MDKILFDQVVHTDYGQFDLTWAEGDFGFDGDDGRYFDGQENGLVGAATGDGVYLCLARRSGGSQVQIQLLDSEPPLPPRAYDDVVEVSVTVPEGSRVTWSTWAGETSGPLDDIGAGTYRLRVSARGRDAGGADEFAEGVIDEYLLQLWSAPARDDTIMRAESENGRYWHQGFGSRR